MLIVHKIIGHASEPRFAGRNIERIEIDSTEAQKRRLRRQTDAGADIAIDLERGTYLRHHAVLADDGQTITIVERRLEDVVVVRLSENLGACELLAQAVRLGHAFGNQHVPVEVSGYEVRVPITTSREVAARTIHTLELQDAAVSFRKVTLGLDMPLFTPTHSHR